MSAFFGTAEVTRSGDRSVRTPPRLRNRRSVAEQSVCIVDTSEPRVFPEARREPLLQDQAAAQTTSQAPLLTGQAEQRLYTGHRSAVSADWTLSPITPSIRQTPIGRRPSVYAMPEHWSGTPPDLPNPSLGAFYSWRLGSPMSRNDRLRSVRNWSMFRPSSVQGPDVDAIAAGSSLTDEREGNSLRRAMEPPSDHEQTDDDAFSPGGTGLGMEPAVSATPNRLRASSPPLSSPSYAGTALPFASENGLDAAPAGSSAAPLDAALITGCSLLQPVSWPAAAVAMTPLTARLREQSQVAADLDPDFAQVALATNDQRLRIKRYQQLYGPVSSPLASSRAVSQASRARTIEPIHAPMSTAVPGMNPQPLCATHPASQSAAERWTTFAPLEQRIEAPQPSIPLGVAQSSRDPGRATPAATIAGMYYRFEHQTLFDSGGVNDTDPEDHSDNLGGIDENSGLASPLVASTRPSCARMHLARMGTYSQRMPLVDAADELNRFELGSVHVLNERHVPNHAYAAVVDAHGPFWNSDPLQEATSPQRKRLRPDAAALSGTAHVHPSTDGKVPNLFRVSIQNGEPVFITESELSASDAALPGAGHPHTMSHLVQRPAKQGRLENKRVVFADHALDADTGSMHSVLTNAYGGTKAKSRKQRVPRHVPLDASAVSTVNESSMTASCLGQSSFLSPCGPLPHTGASATASLSSKRDNQWQEIGRVPTRHDANPYGFELLPGHRLHEPAGYATEASTHAMVSLDGCPADESTDCYTTTEDGGITTLAVDPVTAAELQRASRRLQTPRTHPTRTTAKRCRCRRSRCLKKYCDCFAAGHFCGPECECENCGNHEENRSEVEQARQSASQRSSTNGDGVVGETSLTDRVSLRGCRCKRTGCLKRYCECFQAGRECTVHCACEGCINCRGLSEHLLVEIRKRLA